jgi:hypothetical protein
MDICRMSIRTIFLLLFASASLLSQAQTGRKYANEFLNIGVDARAFGMSGAVIASGSDVWSTYWNPAGVASIRDDWQFGAMHAAYFGNIANYDYLSAATPIDETSSIGISILRFGVDDIMDTSELIDKDGNINYDRIQLFSAADYAFILSYARKAPIEGLQYGANAKIIYRGIGDFAKAFGFGLDLGLQYQRGEWMFGGVLRDATGTFNAWTFDMERFEDVFEATGNELPENTLEVSLPKLQLGAARHFQLGEQFGLLTELDINNTFDGRRNALVSSEVWSLYPALGLEFDYLKMIFVRMGFGNFQRELDFLDQAYTSFQPNIGIGFRYKGVSVDYALTDISDQSSAIYSNVFSLRVDLAAF